MYVLQIGKNMKIFQEIPYKISINICMAREEHVYVYWDEHLKGHAFVYKKPNTNKLVISDGVYDKKQDCEDSAWFCCFAKTDQLDEINFKRSDHCKTVFLH